MRRLLLPALIVPLLVMSGGSEPRAGGNIEEVVTVGGSSKIMAATWNDIAFPIPWKVNAQGVINNCDNGNPTCSGGVSPITLTRAIDALRAGFDAWQGVPTSRITFSYAGTTTQTNIGSDRLNLITWADSSGGLCGTGTVAITPSTRLMETRTLTSSNRDINNDGIIDIDPAIYPNGMVLPAGTIVDADVAWCPEGNDFVDVPLDTTTFTFDIIAVGTHELGHFHGLSHSPLIEPIATMLPFVDSTVDYAVDTRSLSADDIASTSRSYPEAGFGSSFGAVTGRALFPGGTQPATGISIMALDRATGEMTASVITVSQFTATSALPGTFRLDGLPPGTYLIGAEYFDSTIGGPMDPPDDDWWDGNRYNLTVLNSSVPTSGSGTRARPEFYNVGETSTDDLAPPTPVTVAAGQTVDIGTIVINSDPPPAPAGAIPLNLPDDGSIQVLFPAGFTFPFYGQSWSSAYVSSNGNLTFGVASATRHTGNFLGPDTVTGGAVPPRIALSLTDLDPSIDNQGPSGRALDVFSRYVSDGLGDRVEVIYLGVPLYATTKSSTAIARLFRTGRIEIEYRFFSAWWGIVGVTPGGLGVPGTEIDISRQLPASIGSGRALYEHFEFNQPAGEGGAYALRHAFDLNGALLIFTPNALGGYDLTSPTLVSSPPGEVANLMLTGATTLAWDARADATSYGLYRGPLSGLTDADANGVADAYGTCLASGIPTNGTSDASAPAAGAGFFYLATARGPGGEGTLGSASNGLPRPNLFPCP